MEGDCSTSQSPQRAVVPMEEEKEEEITAVHQHANRQRAQRLSERTVQLQYKHNAYLQTVKSSLQV
jgi:hypothetical protein